MSNSDGSLAACWDDYRCRVERRLEQYVLPLVDCPAKLRDSMSYSLMAGGKRLRPLLVLLACEACGGDIERALPAACAVEMVHTYSLIHDDLPAMDDDALRRGRPTNHIVFGEAMAILAGDALLTVAFEVLARDITPKDVACECCLELASASGRVGMVAGQVADLEAEGMRIGSLDQLEAIHRRKTGALLTASLRMGALIGEATTSQMEALSHYGRCFGLAFQVTDDLLDVTGTAEKMGKAVGKDAHLGKATYPGLLGVEASLTKARSLVDEAIRSVEYFGKAGSKLTDLARFVFERDH